MKTCRPRAAWLALFLLAQPSLQAADSIPAWKSYPETASVRSAVDRTARVDDGPSVHLTLSAGAETERAAFFQSVNAKRYLGRAITISAKVKPGDFKGQATLTAATYDGSLFLRYYTQPVKHFSEGRDWQKVDLTFQVPPTATLVSFGLTFKGATGNLWMSKVQFTATDSCDPSCRPGVRSERLTPAERAREETDLHTSPDAPRNLDFLSR